MASEHQCRKVVLWPPHALHTREHKVLEEHREKAREGHTQTFSSEMWGLFNPEEKTERNQVELDRDIDLLDPAPSWPEPLSPRNSKIQRGKLALPHLLWLFSPVTVSQVSFFMDS